MLPYDLFLSYELKRSRATALLKRNSSVWETGLAHEGVCGPSRIDGRLGSTLHFVPESSVSRQSIRRSGLLTQIRLVCRHGAEEVL